MHKTNKRFLIIIILTSLSNCFLFPPEAKYNNSTDNPFPFIITALNNIVNQNTTQSFVLTDTPSEIQEGEFQDVGIRFQSSIKTNKTITIASNDASIVPEPSTLTFEAGQGTVVQKVRLYALIDDDTNTEPAVITFSSDGVESVNLTINHTETTGKWISI